MLHNTDTANVAVTPNVTDTVNVANMLNSDDMLNVTYRVIVADMRNVTETLSAESSIVEVCQCINNLKITLYYFKI